MHPLRVLSSLISLGFFIYIWVVIADKMDSGFIGFLLAIPACIAFWFVVGLVIGGISLLLGIGNRDTYYGYYNGFSYLTKKSSPPTVSAPAPKLSPERVAASQQTWEERLKGKPILPPPE